MIHPVIELLITVIDLYWYVLIAWIVLSWLISFGVVNRYQPFVQRINFALFRLTEPFLKPIRKHMPDLGGIDLSPIVLMLALFFIKRMIIYYAVAM